MHDVERIPQPLGPRIRVARENARLSIQETSSRLGVTAATLEAWESGREVPRANRLFTLAGILNVSLNWFLEGREDKPASRDDAGETQAGLRRQLEEIRSRLDDVLELVDEMEHRLNERD